MPQLYLRAAKSGGCLVVTSLNESQPMTVLEAMGAGQCPVVAADVGGVGGTIFDSVTGRLYPSGDLDSATAAVQQFLRHPLARARIARAGLDFVSLEHSSSRTAELYMALFDEFSSNQSSADPPAAEGRQPGLQASTKVISETRVRHLAARLDTLIGEFVSLHMAMLGRPAAPALARRPSLHFSPTRCLPALKGPSKPIQTLFRAYRLDSSPTSAVLLAVESKQDFSRSPDSCLNTITISFSGTSRWLTLELAISWEEFRDASRYQFGLYAQPDRSLPGQAVLRLPLKAGGTVEHRLAEFRLSELERNCNRSGVLALPDLSEVDAAGKPRLIFFFDSKSSLTLRFDYLAIYFA